MFHTVDLLFLVSYTNATTVKMTVILLWTAQRQVTDFFTLQKILKLQALVPLNGLRFKIF